MMKNRWNAAEARKFKNDDLGLRVYTSRLLGQEPDLVLHGGGNTSVKMNVLDDYANDVEVLYIKASGWDLAAIEKQGFAPVRMDALMRMAEFEHLSDGQMVKLQRQAMLNPYAPNPSVEAILHAIIPYKFVDHTHADSVVTISNSKGGVKRLNEIYKDRVLFVPYVMPGFMLARKVFEMTRGAQWEKLEGIILLNHGIFTFSDNARASYEKMISLVREAERYMNKKNARVFLAKLESEPDLVTLASLRKSVSRARGAATIARLNSSALHVGFSGLRTIRKIALQGPLTPDHVIRTKRTPVIVGRDAGKSVENYSRQYVKYFEGFSTNGLKMLDIAPRWAVWPGFGSIAFGQSVEEVNTVSDIMDHTVTAIQKAEKLGGWQALPSKDIFDVEYWELEQAKLQGQKAKSEFVGKAALVTGSASGIGKACVEALASQGACVIAVDINSSKEIFKQRNVLSVLCDLTDEAQIQRAVSAGVKHFGGLDILISNAGIFPQSSKLEHMPPAAWDKSVEINLTTHQRLLKATLPFLKLGIDPSVIVIASKNVPAPGPGAGAYSVAKAGLTQLARVAALELAEYGIRVNVIHPNAVFDTAIWTDKVLKERAKQYRLSIEEYKKSNLLKVEITSRDVANLAVAMASRVFSKTTGAQVPIDGGNERVI